MNLQDIKIKKIDTGDIAMLKSNIKNNDENLLLLVNETLNFFNPLQDGLNKELCKNDNYAKELSTNTGKLINFGNCIISYITIFRIINKRIVLDITIRISNFYKHIISIYW